MYEPPKGLKPAGLALWKQTTEGVEQGWKLDAHDLGMLEECCRLRDMEARLQRRVDREGILIAGSEGQTVVHPAAKELRLTRALVLSHLRKVEISKPKATTGHLSKHGRDQLKDARRARWSS